MESSRLKHYRAIGFKLTPQRLAVLRYLEGNASHPSAEEVYRAVVRKFPTMSHATVYNVLEALRGKGIITERSLDPLKKRFDPNTAPHHHVICLACGRIEDVHKKILLPKLKSRDSGFVVLRSDITFYGRCPSCREA